MASGIDTQPAERYRRPQPVQLKIPEPRYTHGPRAPAAVDLRSCWRPGITPPAVDSAESDSQRPDGPEGLGGGGVSPWDVLSPPAAYLRATHSPNIEELVSHDSDPLPVRTDWTV